MNALCGMLFAFLTVAQPSLMDDWPAWRGPDKNNVAASYQLPATQWSTDKNVIWKATVPGMGHCSPVIVGNKLFLSTAVKDTETQSVLCFDKTTGQQLWQTKLNQGGFVKQIHANNTHASPTIATSDGRLFVVLNNHRSVQLSALDFEGKILWQKNTGPFIPKFPFGFGSSPCVYKDLVIVLSDYPQDGFVAAYRQSDGKEMWRTKRGNTSSFATPIVANINGQDQLLISGSAVRGYDPATGKELWSVNGPWQVTCGTPVWDGDLVFVSGGFPVRATVAVSASQGKIVWQNQVKAYEQSLLAHNGYVYCHADSGAAYCWRASDGQEMWKGRVTGKGVSASPVLVGDKIFMTSEKGETTIIEANPNELKIIAKNKLGGNSFATPAFVDNRMYTRVGLQKGQEPQYLFCIGE